MAKISLSIAGLLVATVVSQAQVTFTEYPAPSGDPRVITTGPDGNLWFAEAAPSGAHIEDVNLDGLPDLVLQFSTPASQITCSDTASFLVGNTTSGQVIVGSDSVLAVGGK